MSLSKEFSVNANLFTPREETAGIAYDEYDEWNNTVLVRYYGTDGSLTLHKNGYAVIRRRYNENKKLSATAMAPR